MRVASCGSVPGSNVRESHFEAVRKLHLSSRLFASPQAGLISRQCASRYLIEKLGFFYLFLSHFETMYELLPYLIIRDTDPLLSLFKTICELHRIHNNSSNRILRLISRQCVSHIMFCPSLSGLGRDLISR